MDTSNRLDFILGNSRVSPSEVSPAEQVVLVRKAVAICLPYLKHFSGFAELGGQLNKWLGGREHRITAADRVVFSEGVGPDTRCVPLLRFGHEVSHDMVPAGYHFGVRYVTETELVLTQDGRLLLWTARYERVPRFRDGRRDKYDIDEVAVESCFELIDDNQLEQKFKERSSFFWQSIRSLRLVWLRSVDEKRDRLNALMKPGTELTGILERLGVNPN